MTAQQANNLSQAWSAIHDSTTSTLAWIDNVRKNSLGIDNEAENIKLQVYRHRNIAKNLSRVSATPMTVGFFGLSQAGKSYLISALAADAAGDLITDFGGEQLNFIDHINPTGLGQEATGLVTRFSRLAKASPDPAFPVELRLFNEIEIAMILANAWLHDFDQELIDYSINKALITEHLAAFACVDTNAPPPSHVAVEPEDVVALMDNLGKKRSVLELKHVYWGEAIKLIAHLSLPQRAKLFSILWGQQAKITAVYVQLATALQQLGGAQIIYAPLSTLVHKTDTGFVQKNSIMNVDTLNFLGSAQDTRLQVRPLQTDGNLGAPASISTAELTALVNEMTFRLIEDSQHPVVEKVDLLDFPGYRSRLKLPSLDRLYDAEDKSLIAELLLRGKVSYLFERYTNAQEMNGLVMCANSSTQSEVVDINEALKTWIDVTQGETPAERAQRPSGLIWAMTMADIYVQKASATNASQRLESSSNLINITMLQRFDKESWMQNWNGKPFNNTFLVRKPRLPTSFITLDGQSNEIAIASQAAEAVADLRSGFINNEAVQKHVAEPEAAWDAMMLLNNGGITRLGESVVTISDSSFKLQRLTETLEQTKDEIRKSIGQWYHEDADDVDGVQLEKAKQVVSLRSRLSAIGGELLHLLSLDDETVLSIFLNGDYASATDETSDEVPAVPSLPSEGLGLDGFDFGFDVPAAPTSTQVKHSHEYLFAHAVYKAWIAHLRQLTLKNSVLARLNIDHAEQVLPILIEELITASMRKNVVGLMTNKLDLLAQSNARREQIAQSYVLTAQLTIQDFIAYAGYLEEPLANRPTNNQNRAVFDFDMSFDKNNLPLLQEKEPAPTLLYLAHWLMALTTLIKENAGHDAGREITLEQNNELGAILRHAGVL